MVSKKLTEWETAFAICHGLGVSPTNKQVEESAKMIRELTSELQAENARLREVLEFYARNANYRWDSCVDHEIPVIEDKGAKARAALNSKEGA